MTVNSRDSIKPTPTKGFSMRGGSWRGSPVCHGFRDISIQISEPVVVDAHTDARGSLPTGYLLETDWRRLTGCQRLV